MEKIDFKKKFKQYYQPLAKEVTLVHVPVFNYLMIDGAGDPNTSQAYKDAVEALFSVSYAIKFMIKKSEQAIDYSVMPLEGLWWSDNMNSFAANQKAQWKWTMMIMQPDLVSQKTVETAMSAVADKKKLPALSLLRFESFAEGKCAQILHIGPFSEEGPTIARVHQFIEHHSQKTGKHHEIYLSDIRKADPKKWKTIIRQPMA